MKFRLHYRGPLKAKGRPVDKQVLRRAFHPQLKDLWGRVPLVHQAENFLHKDYELSVIREINGWAFSSVISKSLHLVADLDITILRPEEPGAIVTKGGDIDNRLKTLLDALSIPKPDQIPTEDAPRTDEAPLHCLLEDDNLITGLRVSVDRFLGVQDPSEVLAIILVDISATRGTLENLELSM